MPLPVYKKKFTPRLLNSLVDDAVHGIFIPMGQGQKFEEELFKLARNPQRTEEDIARVRDMTRYNWRGSKQKAATHTERDGRMLRATHRTPEGRLAAHLREGVYLIEGKLPISDLEAQLHGIEFRQLEEDASMYATAGMLAMVHAYQHPSLAH